MKLFCLLQLRCESGRMEREGPIDLRRSPARFQPLAGATTSLRDRVSERGSGGRPRGRGAGRGGRGPGAERAPQTGCCGSRQCQAPGERGSAGSRRSASPAARAAWDSTSCARRARSPREPLERRRRCPEPPLHWGNQSRRCRARPGKQKKGVELTRHPLGAPLSPFPPRCPLSWEPGSSAAPADAAGPLTRPLHQAPACSAAP